MIPKEKFLEIMKIGAVNVDLEKYLPFLENFNVHRNGSVAYYMVPVLFTVDDIKHSMSRVPEAEAAFELHMLSKTRSKEFPIDPSEYTVICQGRRTGNTTRSVDTAIQLLFDGYAVALLDHANTKPAIENFKTKLLIRLSVEHQITLKELTTQKHTRNGTDFVSIQLNNPEKYKRI